MDPININLKDISSMCRACLTISDNSASFISLEKDLEARNVFMKTSGNFVCEEDPLPKLICRSCLAKSQELMDFRKKCHDNEIFLRSIIDEAEAEKKAQDESEAAVDETPFIDPWLPCQEAVPKVDEPTTDAHGNPIIKCPVCSLKCTGYREFETHVGTHVSKDNYICPRCGIRYERLDNLRSHMYVHTDHSFRCTECGKTFLRRKTLTDHMAQHHFIYRRKDTLEKIRRRELEPVDKAAGPSKEKQPKVASAPGFDGVFLNAIKRAINCPICSEDCDDVKSFEEHMSTHITRTMRSCPMCSQKFIRYESLRTHLWTHTGEQFHCEQCPKTFASPKALRTHERNYHYVTPADPSMATDVVAHRQGNLHPCEFCGKTFLVVPALQRHLKTHSKAKQFSCKQCDATFRLAKSLKLHEQRHKRVVHYACKLCPATFLDEAQLEMHTASHNTGCLCTVCGLVVDTDSELADHTNKVHNPKLICEVCGETFARESWLNDHVLKHSGERPHDCPVCHKTFRTVKIMRAHIRRIHTQEWQTIKFK